MLRRKIAQIGARPGAFYVIVLAMVAVAQAANFVAFQNRGTWAEAVLPTYTHVIALVLGTIFLFRAVQLVGALIWANVYGGTPLPAPYLRTQSKLPMVTVQIPVRNEPLEVARTAIDAAFDLDYPPDRLEIQVIDNSDGPEFTKAIKEYLTRKSDDISTIAQAPFVSFLHRDGTKGFKAGNLNLGRAQARGEYFLILDADSTVPPATLLQALPYFEDTELGFLQLRVDPTNEEENIVTRAAAVTIRARYMTMRVRDTQGIVQFDGHNGIFRGEALDAVGGWAEEVSEDLVTSVRIILAGYRSRFADLPSGELLPAQFTELYRQRRRWAHGTVDFLKKEGLGILRSSRLRWFQKLDLFYASINILVEAFIWVMLFSFAPLPAMTFLEIVILFSLLPTFLSSRLGVIGTIKRQFALIFVISAILPALAQGALKGISAGKSNFTVTKKNNFTRMGLVDLIKTYAFSIITAFVFLIVAALLAPSVAKYFNSYLPGTIIMGSSFIAPIVLNYWTSKRR